MRVRRSLEFLVSGYQKLRKKHGDKARTELWCRKNGYKWIYACLLNNYDLNWKEFKKRAGFDDDSFEDVVTQYHKILQKYRVRAWSSAWMKKNGYKNLLYKITKLGMTWVEFKQKAGYQRCVQSLKRLIQEYNAFLQGAPTGSGNWFVGLDRWRLFRKILKLYDLTEKEFRQLAGIKNPYTFRNVYNTIRLNNTTVRLRSIGLSEPCLDRIIYRMKKN